MPEKSVLASSLSTILQQSKLMKDNLAEGHLLQALKNCLNFLNELRSSAFLPKEYYELYMAVFDSLESFSAYLLQSNKSKQAKNKDASFLTDLYELVQYSGNIIPRLYMMIVIGTTCMATKNASTKDIMKDMMEMCRGVQHPIRGLFLRHYLSQRLKDLFPMATMDDFNDTVDFLVTNFVEMNKLWVRLQHQGHSSERALRYQERKELKILVGSNLVRLSQVIDDFAAESDYSPAEYYQKKLFPIITEQIIQCKDHLAQSYLIDVLIQIFPDLFHFATLDALLSDVFLKLHPMLHKSELVATLVDRFITFRQYEADLADGVEELAIDEKDENGPKPAEIPNETIFGAFWRFYAEMIESNPSLPAEERVTVLQSFVKLSLAFDLYNFENLDKIYSFASAALSETSSDTLEESVQSLWTELLVTPMEHFSSVKNLLKLSFYFELYEKVKAPLLRRKLSLAITDKLLSDPTREQLTNQEDIDMIYRYLIALIQDPDSQLNTSKDLGVQQTLKMQNGEKLITLEFLKTQEIVCKVLHLVDHEDDFKLLSNLVYIKKKYLNKNPASIVFLYPTLVSKMTNVLRVAGYKAMNKAEDNNEQADLMITSNFKTISTVIEELYQASHAYNAELALKLYLNLASVADQLKQEVIAYEIFSQCFVIYEESLILNPGSGEPLNPHESMGGSISYQSVLMIANRLAALRFFSSENYESLITKVTLYGSKLLKKQDQCRSIYYCAHLWWWCDLLIEGQSPTTLPAEEKSADGDGPESTETKEKEAPLLYRDAKRVLECLQKALRVADSCMDPYLLVKLFVEILNRCSIFHIYENWLVDSRYIGGLEDLIRTNLSNFEDNKVSDVEEDLEARLLRRIEEYFKRTLAYMEEQNGTEEEIASEWR